MDLSWYGPIWEFLGKIISPLIGAFVGVYLGFRKNDNRRMELDEIRRLFFRELLINEAKKSIELLKGGPVNLIPVDAWNSIVNSGNIALFRDRAIELSNAYFDVQAYNYEAKIVRDAFEHEAQWGAPINIETGKTVSRASDLKAHLNDITKPPLLNQLEMVEKWIRPLDGKSITTTGAKGKI